jgi:hypothetical protein
LAKTPFLDRPAARVLAALIILFCGALLAYVHRDDVLPVLGLRDASVARDASNDPAAACIEQRFAEIDGMIDDGIVKTEQAAMFKQRAEAMCRSTEGQGGGPPLPIN